jgi:hypothetical protein
VRDSSRVLYIYNREIESCLGIGSKNREKGEKKDSNNYNPSFKEQKEGEIVKGELTNWMKRNKQTNKTKEKNKTLISYISSWREIHLSKLVFLVLVVMGTASGGQICTSSLGCGRGLGEGIWDQVVAALHANSLKELCL